MQLSLTPKIASDYSSTSQKIRILTENWTAHSIFCPHCGGSLVPFKNNSPVADFYCKNCTEEYELKSKKGKIKKKILGGSYSKMIERLTSENNPNFFFLTYDKSTMTVQNFFAIPKYFFLPALIEKRKALAPTAKRANWVGCKIDISSIPETGKIFFVQNGIPKSRGKVLVKWNKTDFVKAAQNIESKGWVLDVLMCIEKIKKVEFSLEDIYGFEEVLKAKHPCNNNVKAKIRQQLQFLRDQGVLDFVGHAQYRMR